MRLIEHLDLKKDEAINRTFKAIAKNFSTVFTELVPGKLILTHNIVQQSILTLFVICDLVKHRRQINTGDTNTRHRCDGG